MGRLYLLIVNQFSIYNIFLNFAVAIDEDVISLLKQLKDRIDAYGGDGETRVKLVAVGDGAVGKTSLLIAFAQGTFPDAYVPTVFENYTAQLISGDKQVLLHLWDTAGQEDYDRLRPLSYPGADVVLLCFSLVTDSSFDSVKEKWFPEVDHYVPDIPTILVGTKSDLREAKIPDPSTGEFAPVSDDQVNALVSEIGAKGYVAVSAKTGSNLKTVFDKAVSLVLAHRQHLEGGQPISSPRPTDNKPSANMHFVDNRNNGKRKPAGGREGCVMM